jgi:RND family efflux transporter MFP subunit
VKTALGSLRGAQANLEKTLIRAPIAGQVNFLPIRVGDYVAPLTHAATVAQNGALEIVTYVSEENRALLAAGTNVTVEGTYRGVVTTIAPALDPVTKQIEVHVALTNGSGLVNGQSVRIALPNSAVAAATSTGPRLLPLTALKLTPSARVVFSVGADGTLVAHPVEIGDVHGDRIEVTSDIPGDLRIVTDARGLSEGQKVNVATAQ